MLLSILALCPVGILLLVSEVLWRCHKIKGEYARKFVHIFVGGYVATWSYFLTTNQIVALAVCAMIVLTISKYSSLFHAVHDIDRASFGEILYPVAVAAVALLSPDKWVFTVAILFMALSDGMAAVFGTRFAKNRHNRRLFGTHKTVIGAYAFIGFSVLALIIGLFIGGESVMVDNLALVFVVLPISGALLELLSPYGTDNITVPVIVALTLGSLL